MTLRQLEFYLVTTTGTAQGKGNSKECEWWKEGREEGKYPCSALHGALGVGQSRAKMGNEGGGTESLGIKAQARHGEVGDQWG